MSDIKLNLTSEQAWVVATALFEYSKDPINQEHGDLAKEVYDTLKLLILNKINSK